MDKETSLEEVNTQCLKFLELDYFVESQVEVVKKFLSSVEEQFLSEESELEKEEEALRKAEEQLELDKKNFLVFQQQCHDLKDRYEKSLQLQEGQEALNSNEFYSLLSIMKHDHVIDSKLQYYIHSFKTNDFYEMKVCSFDGELLMRQKISKDLLNCH